MMKTIYTLTFHAADNYGAVWQAYALQEYLRKNGIDTSCIDYTPSYLHRSIFTLGDKGLGIMSVAGMIIALASRWKRQNSFARFRKNHLSVVSPDKVKAGHDIGYIVGSDQVWNKAITGNGIDLFFTLENTNTDNKYSYAASIGEDTPENIKEVCQHLDKFKSIGVREKSVYDYLISNGDSRAVWNADPVFLLDKQDYTKIIPVAPSGKYVLVYTLETNYAVKDIINNYRGTHTIISVGTFRNTYGSDQHYRSASPEEFVSLISGADVIISNSFHTIAFGIIYGKKIEYVPLRNGRGSRIDSLLSLLEADRNYCDSSSSNRDNLNMLIKDSKLYLQNIIKQQ